jgi:hypothetical protein
MTWLAERESEVSAARQRAGRSKSKTTTQYCTRRTNGGRAAADCILLPSCHSLFPLRYSGFLHVCCLHKLHASCGQYRLHLQTAIASPVFILNRTVFACLWSPLGRLSKRLALMVIRCIINLLSFYFTFHVQLCEGNYCENVALIVQNKVSNMNIFVSGNFQPK